MENLTAQQEDFMIESYLEQIRQNRDNLQDSMTYEEYLNEEASVGCI